jgi:hypothetical protein
MLSKREVFDSSTCCGIADKLEFGKIVWLLSGIS